MFALNKSACKTLQCTVRRGSACAAVIHSVSHFPVWIWKKSREGKFEHSHTEKRFRKTQLLNVCVLYAVGGVTWSGHHQ